MDLISTTAQLISFPDLPRNVLEYYFTFQIYLI